MSRKPDNNARQEILGNVINAISTGGLNNLSLRDIAHEVGTSGRMLIYYFESYENLVNEIFIQLSNKHKLTLKSILNENSDKSLEEIFRIFIENIFTSDYRTTLLLFLELYTKALRDVQAYNTFFNVVLHGWIDEVEIIMTKKNKANSRLHASMIVSFFRGLMLDWLAANDKKRIIESSNLFVKLVLKM